MRGVALADIMNGLFHLPESETCRSILPLQFIDAVWNGDIENLCGLRRQQKKPEIEVTPNVFKITLPNVNAAAVSENFSVNPLAQEERILQLAKEKGVISRKDVEMLLDVSQTLAGQILRKLSEKQLLIKNGNGKNTKYLFPN